MKQHKEAPVLSLQVNDAKSQLEALKASRLRDFVKDPAILNRMYEAALYLLKNDALRACDEASIFGALYKAVTLKFRLEEDFGEYYLIPRRIFAGKDENGQPIYKSVCTGQIGYKGWKALALQSGHVLSIEAREVYKEDEFSFKYGTAPFLEHVPAETNKGEMIWFYAMALLPNGVKLFEVINRQRAEKSRKNSETQYETIGGKKVFLETPPAKTVWAKFYDKMALRTPIKAVCAMLPLSEAIETAIREDGAVTYLQKDGTVTTIGPADVEAIAEKPEGEKNPVEGLNTEIADKFLQVSDALSAMDFDAVCEYYKRFDGSKFAANKIFAKLFFDRAASQAKEAAQLNTFYNLATKWKKETEFYEILAARKTAIEKEAANG